MPTIAILGASGKVGFATSTTLRRAGVTVRAILRDESKAPRLRSIGCEIAYADLHDVSSLATAFEHADAIQIILPPAPGGAQDMQRTLDILATALEKSPPKQLLAISDYGAHVRDDIGMPSIFRVLEERLGRIDQCGHKIFLRSAEHMENFGRDVPSAVASGVLNTLHQDVDRKFPTICASDLGEIAAQLLLRPVDPGQGVKVVHAEGPRRYSAEEVATVIGEISNRKVVVKSVPRSQWEDNFGRVMSLSLAELLIKANDAQNKGGLVDVEPGADDVFHGTTKLTEVLKGLIRS